jgi:hypothetical protein
LPRRKGALLRRPQKPRFRPRAGRPTTGNLRGLTRSGSRLRPLPLEYDSELGLDPIRTRGTWPRKRPLSPSPPGARGGEIGHPGSEAKSSRLRGIPRRVVGGAGPASDHRRGGLAGLAVAPCSSIRQAYELSLVLLGTDLLLGLPRGEAKQEWKGCAINYE